MSVGEEHGTRTVVSCRIMRPRIHFRLRTVLVVVAVAAAALTFWRHAESFQRAADAHERKAQMYADAAWGLQRFDLDPVTMLKALQGEAEPDEQARLAAKEWSLYEEHLGLAEEHRRAVWRAWLQFAARPPLPEPAK